MVWLRSGRPYGIDLHPAGAPDPPTSYRLDQIAASVAPPMLTTRSSEHSDSARIRAGSESGTQSPLSHTSRRLAGSRSRVCSACATSSSMNAGTVFHTVTPCETTSRSQAAGSGGDTTSDGGTTTDAPADSNPNTSYTDRSNESDDNASTRSARPTP